MMRSPDLRMRTYADFKKSSVLYGHGRKNLPKRNGSKSHEDAI